MPENNLATKSVRRASSLKRYAIRAGKDTCLHNDVGDFLAKHGTGTARLVDKLLNNDFVLARYTDPTYPA